MIRKLAHLCFITDDLERMRAFYAETLGLPVQFRFLNPEGETFGYYFNCGDSSFIEIFDHVLVGKQWGHSQEPLQGGSRYTHFCLEVTGMTELKASLEAKGLEVGPIRSGMDRSLQCWTKDPDGNAIEFMEYTHASLQIQRELEGLRATA